MVLSVWGLANSAAVMGRWRPSISFDGSLCCAWLQLPVGATVVGSQGYEDLNSGPHACTASTFPSLDSLFLHSYYTLTNFTHLNSDLTPFHHQPWQWHDTSLYAETIHRDPFTSYSPGTGFSPMMVKTHLSSRAANTLLWEWPKLFPPPNTAALKNWILMGTDHARATPPCICSSWNSPLLEIEMKVYPLQVSAFSGLSHEVAASKFTCLLPFLNHFEGSASPSLCGKNNLEREKAYF